MTGRLHRILLQFAAQLGVMLLAAACGGGHGAVKLTLRTESADATPSNQFVMVESTGDWTLTLVFDGQTDGDFTPWAYFGNDIEQVEYSGSGTRKDVVLNWIANASPDGRAFTLIAQCGSSSTSARFVQAGRTSGSGSQLPDKLVSDELGAWMELPATNTDGLYYFSHGMQIGDKTTRNYSYGWDPEHLVALWVAYPLNAWTISSGDRSNVWGLDPKVPRKMQPVVFSAFSAGNAGRCDRGHQIPSADRLSYDANVQTFYGTNMTPQRSSLNSGAWSVLEGKVRNWSRQFDTLYVVTGCTVEGSTEYCYDNDRKKVTVPTGYYKALLGYKKTGTLGITGSTGGYTAIGFWFEHQQYTANESTVMAQSTTIDDLEARTGFDFFVHLPGKIGQESAARVESTIDSWWK